ncbi:uncharacterized protein AruCF_3670 [Achromobacter ruhlandii]|nr:uncharacterized protein AruCF_3670 [Achromobacter ruhlandii]
MQQRPGGRKATRAFSMHDRCRPADRAAAEQSPKAQDWGDSALSAGQSRM